MEDNIKDLTKNLRIPMEEDKNINFVMQKYLSCEKIPKDS
jgi:hypothetical protein